MSAETPWPGDVAINRYGVVVDESCLHEHAVRNDCSCTTCIDHSGRDLNFMVVCATCGSKRCPHALDHDFRCAASNEYGQTAVLA